MKRFSLRVIVFKKLCGEYINTKELLVLPAMKSFDNDEEEIISGCKKMLCILVNNSEDELNNMIAKTND